MVWWPVSHDGMTNIWWPSMRFNKRLVALILLRRWKYSWPMKLVNHCANCFDDRNAWSILMVWWTVSNGGTGKVWLPSMVGLIQPKSWKWPPSDPLSLLFLFWFVMMWKSEETVMGVMHATSKDIGSLIPSNVSHQLQLEKIGWMFDFQQYQNHLLYHELSWYFEPLHNWKEHE